MAVAVGGLVLLVLPGAARSVGCECLLPAAEGVSWLSPTTIVYMAGTERNVYVRDLDGAPRRITDEPGLGGERRGLSRFAQASPDGESVAYVAHDGLALVSRDGVRRRVLDPVVGQGRVAWSHDQRWLAYGGPTGGVRVVAASGGEPRVVGLGHDPDWSPDSSLLAYVSGGRLRLVRPDGSGERALGSGEHPHWSPDGARIAFTRDGSSVWLVDVATGTEQRIASGSEATWLPDGSSLVYAGPTYDLRLIDAGGGLPRVLVDNAQENHDPVAAPDGMTIGYVVRNEGGGSGYAVASTDDVYTVRIDGTARRELTGVCGIDAGDDPGVVCLDRGDRSVPVHAAGRIRVSVHVLPGSYVDRFPAVLIDVAMRDDRNQRVRGAGVVARGRGRSFAYGSTDRWGRARLLLRLHPVPAIRRESVRLQIEGHAEIRRTISFPARLLR